MKAQFVEVGPKKVNTIVEAPDYAGLHAIIGKLLEPDFRMLPTGHQDIWQLINSGHKAGYVKILKK
jgi:hypothetical protein